MMEIQLQHQRPTQQLCFDSDSNSDSDSGRGPTGTPPPSTTIQHACNIPTPIVGGGKTKLSTSARGFQYMDVHVVDEYLTGVFCLSTSLFLS